MTFPARLIVTNLISVSLGCGSSTSENLTYFESGTTVVAGACRAKICKCNSNICQVSFIRKTRLKDLSP